MNVESSDLNGCRWVGAGSG